MSESSSVGGISGSSSSEKEEAEKRLSEQLEKNRILIVAKLDEMNQLNQKLKKDYVPVSVINNLSQSIKEVEVKKFFLPQIKSYSKKPLRIL